MRSLWLGASCLLFLLAAVSRVDAAEAEDANPPAAPVDPGPPAKMDPDLKNKALSQAFVMLAGIIVGGTLLLLVVVMWGNRTRRLARRPLPNVSRRDELWFLKPKPGADPAEPDQPPPGQNGAEMEK